MHLTVDLMILSCKIFFMQMFKTTHKAPPRRTGQVSKGQNVTGLCDCPGLIKKLEGFLIVA